MGERSGTVREVRKRRRRRQRRRAWAVVTALFLCIMAADFLGGFLVGCSWQKSTGRELLSEIFAADTEGGPVAGTWENAVYHDGQGDAVQDDNPPYENGPEGSADETAGGAAMQEECFDGQWNLLLVNNWHPVPESCEVDLVEVDGGEQVDRRIYEPLMTMLEDAREANWGQLPRVVSGYRTAEKQQQLYDDKIAEYRRQGYPDDEAEELAQQWVAIPGFSEHQLGFAVDINGATYDVYLWLQENSYRYGFIFRYPGHKTELTGVAEEVWHYRYVGVEAAAEIYEQGICLEEYVENMENRNL